MEKTERKEKRYGLIGKDISYSFSRGYFSEKFTKSNLLDHSYENFDLANISEFKDIVNQNHLSGLNVTIPYKELIIPFLDELDTTAERIGAVNTIRFKNDKLMGYNTDAYGFKESLSVHLKGHHKNALILGTGGASKAIAHVFDELDIPFQFVSRNPKKQQLRYQELNKKIIEDHQIIVNCSPVGTYPNIHQKPEIPYKYLTKNHLLFDLIYNPSKTVFLKEGDAKGAIIQNGLPMLEFQAEKSWEIWNS
ncbi:shikimate dehydrogenase [Croceitalea sp. MTPC9]|uniref:shikimate dehydrogenase family protein n=1 Tax=unclassified Croceitalea TaxID=2632280 RepID=UPI002B3FF451|nr:shikimate dehydrogenase [Croceitalea sp. MTPC6]GMN15230.1 shikimate dehydrogenase [Croceitalea sp. MTPC9]